MFVFHGQRKAASAVKLCHICSVISDIECFDKISETKPNKAVLEILLCISFYVQFSYFCPPFSPKEEYINFGLFLLSSVSPPVSISLI